MPTVSRPSLRKSRLASEFASASGLVYCGPTSTLVPRPTASVDGGRERERHQRVAQHAARGTPDPPGSRGGRSPTRRRSRALRRASPRVRSPPATAARPNCGRWMPNRSHRWSWGLPSTTDNELLGERRYVAAVVRVHGAEHEAARRRRSRPRRRSTSNHSDGDERSWNQSEWSRLVIIHSPRSISHWSTRPVPVRRSARYARYAAARPGSSSTHVSVDRAQNRIAEPNGAGGGPSATARDARLDRRVGRSRCRGTGRNRGRRGRAPSAWAASSGRRAPAPGTRRSGRGSPRPPASLRPRGPCTSGRRGCARPAS